MSPLMFPQVIRTPWHFNAGVGAVPSIASFRNAGRTMAAGHVWFGSMLLKKDYGGVC